MGDRTMGVESIGVACEGELAVENCTSFVDAMTRTFPQFNVALGGESPSDLDVVLRMDQLSQRSLSAQISWTGAHEGQGPLMTSGISNGQINQRQLTTLIDDLITQTEWPL